MHDGTRSRSGDKLRKSERAREREKVCANDSWEQPSGWPEREREIIGHVCVCVLPLGRALLAQAVRRSCDQVRLAATKLEPRLMLISANVREL